MSNPQMKATAAIPRTEPDDLAGEWESLGQWLDYHRATLLLKCADLTDEQLKQRPLPSALSLLGLLRHLTDVERDWFVETLGGQEVTPRYSSANDHDGDFTDLDSHPVADVLSAYRAAVDEARAVVATFTSADELRRMESERPVNVRWVMMHLVEEYARHNGHADLLREAVDGVVGE
jgi:uncharacterized damage-inducible protein DinB